MWAQTTLLPVWPGDPQRSLPCLGACCGGGLRWGFKDGPRSDRAGVSLGHAAGPAACRPGSNRRPSAASRVGGAASRDPPGGGGQGSAVQSRSPGPPWAPGPQSLLTARPRLGFLDFLEHSTPFKLLGPQHRPLSGETGSCRSPWGWGRVLGPLGLLGALGFVRRGCESLQHSRVECGRGGWGGGQPRAWGGGAVAQVRLLRPPAEGRPARARWGRGHR